MALHKYLSASLHATHLTDIRRYPENSVLSETSLDKLMSAFATTLAKKVLEFRECGNFFENEWQSFRTKKDWSLELISVAHECSPGRRKIAVKVVDIFGNDTITIIEVSV